MLDVVGLTASYGPVRALEDVDLHVEQGAITAVLGANGAGKTTLLRVISGLLRPQQGTVRFAGRDVTRRPPEALVRLGMAHVPEGRGVIAELTVEENLRLGDCGGATARGCAPARRRCSSCSRRLRRGAASAPSCSPAVSGRC